MLLVLKRTRGLTQHRSGLHRLLGRLSVVATALALPLLIAGTAAGDGHETIYQDAPGTDSNVAGLADIERVHVSTDASGTHTFRFVVPNREGVLSGDLYQIYLNVDEDLRTDFGMNYAESWAMGTSPPRSFCELREIAPTPGVPAPVVPAPTLACSVVDGDPVIRINASDLRGALRFNVSFRSNWGPPGAPPNVGGVDDVPGGGNFPLYDPTADLELQGGVSPNPVRVGQELTYTLFVENDGPRVAQEVTLRKALPASVSFRSATPTSGSCTGATEIVCNFGALPEAATASVTIKAVATAAGTLSSQASVSAQTPDSELANNTGTFTTEAVPPDDDQPDPGAHGRPSERPWLDFAPLLIFHETEAWWPMQVDRFLAHSSLKWRHAALWRGAPRGRRVICRATNELIAESVSQYSLSNNSYVHSARKLVRDRRSGKYRCVHRSKKYHGDDYTRPYENVAPRKGLSVREGFFLDVPNGVHPGQRDVMESGLVPVYYEWRPGTDTRDGFVTFWFFYGYSTAPDQLPLSTSCCHEGDWEHISIRLGPGNQPEAVAYFKHHERTPTPIPWNEVQKDRDGHPYVYVARGGHASYHNTDCGGLPYGDRCGTGTTWETWRNVDPARTQPWYGFGGGWGGPGTGNNRTGPTGPSPYKSPSNWQ